MLPCVCEGQLTNLFSLLDNFILLLRQLDMFPFLFIYVSPHLLNVISDEVNDLAIEVYEPYYASSTAMQPHYRLCRRGP